MKSILISIKPEWVAKILNKEKTIEVRKTAPKCELPIEVYIYCTKSAPYLHQWTEVAATEPNGIKGTNKVTWEKSWHLDKKKWYMSRNGKIVAKFTLREVTEYINSCNVSKDSGYMFGDAEREGVYEKSCLSESDIDRYCPDESFYAWHISDLEIFDRPRGLCEFHTNVKKEPPEELLCPECGEPMEYYEYKYLTKAPRSWQFIEVE